jgi:hypothetical protein
MPRKPTVHPQTPKFYQSRYHLIEYPKRVTIMHDEPLDITPDVIIWVAVCGGVIAFVILVIGAAILVSRLRDKIAGRKTPRRTSATTWIASVAIMVYVLGDTLAVLIPAIQAAKAQSNQPDAAPANPPRLRPGE